jgi:hypothetical protein
MTAGPLVHADERFTLGVRGGFRPSAEGVSDTDVTPFGLSMRTIPVPGDGVMVCMAGGRMAKTESVTTYQTDGKNPTTDMKVDYLTD